MHMLETRLMKCTSSPAAETGQSYACYFDVIPSSMSRFDFIGTVAEALLVFEILGQMATQGRTGPSSPTTQYLVHSNHLAKIGVVYGWLE